MSYDLVGLGEPLVTFVADRAGPLRSVPRFERALAGAECNALLGAARLGLRCQLLARVGDDEFGRFIVETLRAGDVDATLVQSDADRFTGLYFRERSALGLNRRPLYYRAGSAGSAIALTGEARRAIESAAGFLTTGITSLISDAGHDAATEALRIARTAGVTTYFDPNLRPGLPGSHRARALLLPLLASVDVYLGGEAETQQLLGAEADGAELAKRVRSLGPDEVVIKRGHYGAVALRGETHEAQPAYPVAERESIGAGDAFNAGYIVTRRSAADLAEALRAAAVCGAAACVGTGDWETFPRPAELADALARWT